MTGTNLLRLVPDVADRDVYRCAAPELSRAVRAALREVGLPARRLHEEAFSF
jgi:ferredoxin-NADP reductase